MRPHRDISIGIAGWSYPDWEGIVYPKSSIDKLAFAADLVDCIEINSTFTACRTAKFGLVAGPRRREERFFFTAKLHQTFTHEESLIRLRQSNLRKG